MKNIEKHVQALSIVVGFMVFVCSFYVEQEIIRRFISNDFIAIALTLALEGGKIAAIIWHYAGTTKDRYLTGFFRVSLVGLSVVCSVLYLTAKMDRPNLDEVINKKIQVVNEEYTEYHQQLINKFKDLKDDVRARQKEEIEMIQASYAGEIMKYGNLALNEMNNTGPTGKWKGQRYNELVAKREALEAELATKQEQLIEDHRNEFRKLETQATKELTIINNDFTNKKDAIRQGKNLGQEVNDEYVVAFTNVFNELGIAIQPIQFISLFSIFISIMMELCIILSFASIVPERVKQTTTKDEPEMIEIPKGQKVVLRWETEQKRSKKLKTPPTLAKKCKCSTWSFTPARQKLIDDGRNHYACEACGEPIK